MKVLLFPILMTVLSAGALAQPELTLDQVIQKHFEAQGGVEKLKAIKTVKATGKFIMGGGTMEAPLTLTIKKPQSMRMEMTFQGRSIVTGFDGKTAWMINPMTGSSEPTQLGEDEVKDMAEQADFEGPLMDYKTKGNAVELIGKEDVEGAAAYKLKITTRSGRTQYQFLDAKSFLAVKTIGRRKAMGQDLEVEAFLGNYKPVNGIMMAHSIDSKVSGKTIAQMAFESFAVNEGVDDSIFRMPPPPEKKAPEQK